MSKSFSSKGSNSSTNMAMPDKDPKEIMDANHTIPFDGLNASSDSIFGQGDFERSLHVQPIAFSTPKRALPVAYSSTPANPTSFYNQLELMNNSELKSTIITLVEETESLKKEVEMKDKLIAQAQLQVKSLIENDLSKSFASPAFNPTGRNQMNTSYFQNEIQKSFENSQGQRRLQDRNSFYLEPQCGSTVDLCIPEESAEDPERNGTENIPTTRRTGMFPETTLVLIREMTNFINLGDASLSREHIQEACYLSGQICVGAAAGWGSAFFVKNFGKAALTALGGGGIIIGYAQYKGYIHINWNEIFEQLDHVNTSSRNESNLSTSSASPSSTWTTEQLRVGREWVNNHSVTAGSFLVSFLYNLI